MLTFCLWPSCFSQKSGVKLPLDYYTYYFALAGFILLIAFIGNVVGIYVEEVDSFTKNVFTKDEQFQNVVVIIATSHHTALLMKDNSFIVIPSGNIKRIQTSAAH